MKTPSRRLYDLIHALDRSEKRYCKLALVAKDPEAKYARLFDLIDAQADFDDEALLHAIYGEEPPKSQKFSELKAYLYNFLLSCLQQYDERQSVDHRLKNMLASVHALFRRSLFDDCRYVLRKARKLAEPYERFATLLEIYDWERRLAYARTDFDFLDEHLAALHREEEQRLAQLTNFRTYQELFYELYLVTGKNRLSAEEQSLRVQALSEHPLLTDPAAARSHGARVWRGRILAVLAYFRRDLEDFYAESKALIELLESRPKLLREDVSIFIAALSNYAVSCGYLGRYAELRRTLAKLRAVRPRTMDDRVKIHRQYYSNYFRLCIESGNFSEGLAVLEEHLREAEQLDQRSFARGTYFFQYFYIYFGAERYDEALHYLNQWLDLPRSVEQQDLQSLARLLNLILHHEMDNQLLLSSLLRSTERHLRKRRRMMAFEALLLGCLRQVNRATSQRE
ncbi:MAG: hypothetical protein KDC54_07815, partial [Lewinella sp.]|nr:hypothetical protein [Lewinella sp.]